VLPARGAVVVLRSRPEGRLLQRGGLGELWMQVAPATGPLPLGGPGLDTSALWLQFRSQLRSFVARRISDQADVEDTVQWVFLRLHESRVSLERTDRVHAWLFRTARRAIVDHYRTKARRRDLAVGDTGDLDSLAEAVGHPRPAQEDELWQAAECLAPLIEDLPLPYREAIVLSDLQGVRLADAAKEAGVSLSGMKSRVQRGRQRLKQLLLDCCQIALAARSAVPACDAKPGSCGSCAGGD
jgi:RNA polymerase sigma-70 factor, ECF subfamily